MTDEQHPANNWEFHDDAEDAFVQWFNDLCGSYSLRSEWFHGDCEEQDENQRKEIMRKWVHAAYIAGYQKNKENLK